MGKVLCSLIEESENRTVAAFVSAEFETEKEIEELKQILEELQNERNEKY